jgi:hypothetical protein
LNSPAKLTQSKANISHLFVQRAQPKSPYIAVPSVSSESRKYVPIDYFPPEVVANNRVFTIADAGLAVFAVLKSRPFNIWNRTVSGRLESRFSLSAEITYNNFPLPVLTPSEKQALEGAGSQILEARAKYPESSLADLYGINSMPLDLLKAHESNDKLVLKLFGLNSSSSDEQVLSKLFSEYESLTQGLISNTKQKGAK